MTDQSYSRDHYFSFASAPRVDQFYRGIDRLNALCTEQGWSLRPFFRNRYCAFKGADKGLTAFGIMFGPDGHLFLYIKRVYSEATGFPIRFVRYDEGYDQVEYALELGGSDLKTFLPLLKLAYELSI